MLLFKFLLERNLIHVFQYVLNNLVHPCFSSEVIQTSQNLSEPDEISQVGAKLFITK